MSRAVVSFFFSRSKCTELQSKRTLDGIHQSSLFIYAYISSIHGLSIFKLFRQLIEVRGPQRNAFRLSHALSGLRRDVHVRHGPLMSSTPTTRSRTLLFLSYRDSRASSSTSHHRYALETDGDENERLIDPTKDHIAIDVRLPPKWSGRLQR